MKAKTKKVQEPPITKDSLRNEILNKVGEYVELRDGVLCAILQMEKELNSVQTIATCCDAFGATREGTWGMMRAGGIEKALLILKSNLPKGIVK